MGRQFSFQIMSLLGETQDAAVGRVFRKRNPRDAIDIPTYLAS